jgi:hypothetical protein
LKITETIERDCCENQDLATYRGLTKMAAYRRPKFCKHCGQIWYFGSQPDGAGSSVNVLKPAVATEDCCLEEA